jgi:hypothetical protein
MAYKYKTTWERAKKTFNAKMRDFNDDGSKTIQYFIDQAAFYNEAAKADPTSAHSIFAFRMERAAAYGINLAFGIDKAAK